MKTNNVIDGNNNTKNLDYIINGNTTFKNFIFEYNLFIKNDSQSDDIVEIVFENCVFNEVLDLKKVFNIEKCRITFIQSIFQGINSSKAGSIIVNINIKDISFYNCYIKDIYIENSIVNNLIFYNTLAESLFILKNNTIENIKFEYKWTDLKLALNENHLYIFEKFFEHQKEINFYINGGFKNFNMLYNEYDQENRQSVPYFGNFNSEVLKRLNFKINFSFDKYENNPEGKINLSNLVIRNINFNGNFFHIDLKNCTTNQFSLSNFNVQKAIFAKLKESSFDLSETIQEIRDNLEKKRLETRVNREKEEFKNRIYEYENKSIFNIYKSNLSNTIFWNTEIDTFENVNIYQSFLENCTFAIVNFPEKISTTENIFDNIWKGKPIDYHEEYEIYRQLYNLFNKNGDIVNALKMRSNQMNALLSLKKKNEIKNEKSNCLKRKLIKLKSVITKWIKKLDREIILLYINKYSNNFGNSSTRALLFIILFSILFTSLCLWSFGYTIDISYNGYETFSKNLFSVILNPFSNNKNMIEEGEPNFISYPLLFVSKIVITFLYYQFVAAYRRFGKTDK